jgi:hypothetical protein
MLHFGNRVSKLPLENATASYTYYGRGDQMLVRKTPNNLYRKFRVSADSTRHASTAWPNDLFDLAEVTNGRATSSGTKKSTASSISP